MGYSPFVNDKSHKLINMADFDKAAKGLTVLIRRFDEGNYQRWQQSLGEAINRENQTEEERKASSRDVLLEIGIMEWNFKDEKGESVPATVKTVKALDSAVTMFLRDEIWKHNPCFWPYMTAKDIKRLGLEGKVKNG